MVASMVVGDFHCPHEIVQVTADHPRSLPGVWVDGDPENQTAGVWVIAVLVQSPVSYTHLTLPTKRIV